MSFPVVIQSGVILFNLYPPKPNGVAYKVSTDSWLTEYGLIIPVDFSSYNAQVFLNNKSFKNKNTSQFDNTRFLLLDSSGSINDITIDLYSNYNINPVHYGLGCKYVRAADLETEQHISTLFSLGYTNEQIIEYIKKNTLMQTNYLYNLPVQKLVDSIKDLNVDFLELDLSSFKNK